MSTAWQIVRTYWPLMAYIGGVYMLAFCVLLWWARERIGGK